jgi:hypothetical protein
VCYAYCCHPHPILRLRPTAKARLAPFAAPSNRARSTPTTSTQPFRAARACPAQTLATSRASRSSDTQQTHAPYDHHTHAHTHTTHTHTHTQNAQRGHTHTRAHTHTHTKRTQRGHTNTRGTRSWSTARARMRAKRACGRMASARLTTSSGPFSPLKKERSCRIGTPSPDSQPPELLRLLHDSMRWLSPETSESSSSRLAGDSTGHI